MDATSKSVTTNQRYVIGASATRELRDLLQWTKQRKELETKLRPDVNIHKVTLIETWNQMIREIELRLGEKPTV